MRVKPLKSISGVTPPEGPSHELLSALYAIKGLNNTDAALAAVSAEVTIQLALGYAETLRDIRLAGNALRVANRLEFYRIGVKYAHHD